MGKERIYNSSDNVAKRKNLRNYPTDAEIVLWSRLQRRQLQGKKFRRQHGVGPYIVDFYCPECRVIVELDGAGHFTDEAIKKDAERTEFLEGLGLRVIRFQNYKVLRNLQEVLETIAVALQKPPRPRSRAATPP